MSQTGKDPRNLIAPILIFMVGQVGCIALVIISASVLGGLWLDNLLGTKPILTLLLLLAGVPISIALMFFVSRRTVAKIRDQVEAKKE